MTQILKLKALPGAVGKSYPAPRIANAAGSPAAARKARGNEDAMLATFVIGLREGLEAALIVGIIAAYLRRNGRPLGAMWVGVALAVALSIAVGVALDLAERSLPQAGQEGMEAVVGAVAVVFVTGMIAWMNVHARDMKRQIETEAANALGRAGRHALVAMAFLAVLKEGFETGVFLLATVSAAQSAALTAAGAFAGLLAAVGIGWGIFAGAVRIDLSRFFRITNVFLLLVAAGLVATSLRNAHEAGWLLVGQQRTIDLSWLVAPGTVRSALLTGVLGIPADPRLVEAIGWAAYLVPVAVYVFWPSAWRPRPRTSARLRLAGAGALLALALALALLYPVPRAALPDEAALVAPDGRTVATARLEPATGDTPARIRLSSAGGRERLLVLDGDGRRHVRHDGADAVEWTIEPTGAPAGAPETLTLDRIVALSGGRVPVGLDRRSHPGPFSAAWSTHRSVRIWTAEGLLLDAAGNGTTLVTISGGGLQTPRTLTARTSLPGEFPMRWRLSAADRDRAAATAAARSAASAEHRFWAVRLPLALLAAALAIAAFAARSLVGLARAPGTKDTDPLAREPSSKGATHAAR